VLSIFDGRWRPLLPVLPTLLVLATPGLAQDPAKGKDLFERRCGGCHSLDRDKEGPRLRDVYGRVSGAVSSFKYSDALKNARVTWNSESLDKWLTDTDKLVPDNDMAFRVASPEERSAIIAYLKQLSGK
jgi:cytochrome c